MRGSLRHEWDALSAEYRMRPGRPDDLEGLLAMQEVSFGAPRWSGAIWAELLKTCAGRTVVVMEREVLVGFSVVAVVGGVAELESVVVLEQHRGHGLGRALCAQALTWAAQTGAAEMLLEVRASNGVALGLYKALGFTEQGRRRAYYTAPAEDAVMMARVLTAQR